MEILLMFIFFMQIMEFVFYDFLVDLNNFLEEFFITVFACKDFLLRILIYVFYGNRTVEYMEYAAIIEDMK